MKKYLLIITLLFSSLFSSLFSYSQENILFNEYLSKLYNGFPIEMELDSLETNYLKKLNYEESVNIYDSTKIDFKKTINQKLALIYQPTNASIEHFYAYDWGGGPKHSIITALSLDYSNSSKRKSEKQFKEIVERLAKLTAKNIKYEIYADSGKIGYGYRFFKSFNDSLPIITTDIMLQNCIESTNYIYITYMRNLEN